MRALLVSVILVSAAGLLGYFISRPLKSPSLNTPTASTAPLVTLPKALQRLYEEPRQLPPTPAISVPCQRLWRSLFELDLAINFTPITSEDCENLPEPIISYHRWFEERCRSGKKSECLSAIYQYRAHITHFTTANTELSLIRDPKILLDKLMATFEREPKLALRIADRFLELEPDNYSIHKAALLAALLSGSETDEVVHRLGQLDRLEGSDKVSNAELRLLTSALRDKDADRVSEMAEEIREQFPNAAFAPYFQAWAENERGNREGALSYLKEALLKNPNNASYQQTYQKLQEPGNGKIGNAFSVQHSFPLMPR